jgi:hypothetical protein
MLCNPGPNALNVNTPTSKKCGEKGNDAMGAIHGYLFNKVDKNDEFCVTTEEADKAFDKVVNTSPIVEGALLDVELDEGPLFGIWNQFDVDLCAIVIIGLPLRVNVL